MASSGPMVSTCYLFMTRDTKLKKKKYKFLHYEILLILRLASRSSQVMRIINPYLSCKRASIPGQESNQDGSRSPLVPLSFFLRFLSHRAVQHLPADGQQPLRCVPKHVTEEGGPSVCSGSNKQNNTGAPERRKKKQTQVHCTFRSPPSSPGFATGE